jgi:hypothetical protein
MNMEVSAIEDTITFINIELNSIYIELKPV